MADETEYEICPTLEDADAKLSKINVLLGYPNGAQSYRVNILHPVTVPEDLRAIGLVTQKLIDACSEMSEQERLQYYNENELYTVAEVAAEGWFPE